MELTQKLGITPFAALPYVRAPGEMRRRRAIILVALLFAALGIPALLWAVNTYYLPLDLLLDRVITRLGVGAVMG